MAKRVPAQVQPARVIHYLEPQPSQSSLAALSGMAPQLLLHAAEQLERKRSQERVAYARWVARQREIAERDRKFRRFWLGFGAVVGAGVLVGAAALGWLAYHLLVGSVVGVGGLLLLALAGAAVVVGGHRCVTIVQHWH